MKKVYTVHIITNQSLNNLHRVELVGVHQNMEDAQYQMERFYENTKSSMMEIEDVEYYEIIRKHSICLGYDGDQGAHYDVRISINTVEMDTDEACLISEIKRETQPKADVKPRTRFKMVTFLSADRKKLEKQLNKYIEDNDLEFSDVYDISIIPVSREESGNPYVIEPVIIYQLSIIHKKKEV